MSIRPVILSGGSGTRLWPLSRTALPKQFIRFGERDSLFQQALARARTVTEGATRDGAANRLAAWPGERCRSTPSTP